MTTGDHLYLRLSGASDIFRSAANGRSEGVNVNVS